MSKINVGDTVICIKPAVSRDGYILERGKEYTINDIVRCDCDVLYDVGFPIMPRHTSCDDCNVMVSTHRWFLMASRFIKNFQPSKNIPVEKFN